jgi:DNA polymerase I
MRLAKKLGICLPSKIKLKRPKYKGAIIHEPKLALNRNIVHLDFKSMYPSIILSYNLSPETWDLNGDLVIDRDLELVFKSSPMGIVPRFITEVSQPLKEWKEGQVKQALMEGKSEEVERLETQLDLFKYVGEAGYGLMGAERSRFASKPSFKAAETITYVGREVLMESKRYLEEEKGVIVEYGDTDGLFLSMGDLPLEDLVYYGKKFMEELNPHTLEFLTKRFGKPLKPMKIDLKIIFDTFITFTKKRYSGKYIWYKGKLKTGYFTKGLQSIRSDSSKVAKKLQESMVKSKLDLEPIEARRKLLTDCVSGLESYSPWELGTPTKMKKDFAEYSGNPVGKIAAQYSNAYLETTIKKGMRFRRLPILEVPKGWEPTKWVGMDEFTDLPEGFKINWNLVKEDISNKVEEVLALDGMKWEDFYPKPVKEKKIREKKV